MAGPPAKHILGQLNHLLQAGEAADDGQLLERFVHQRDEDAFARLVARHGGLVFGVCRRVLGDRHAAEDVFQATFLVLARRAGGIRKPGSLASFLHGVAYRLAIKARGETGRRRERERHLPPPVESEEPDLSWREVRTLIDEELQRLPERLRLPLVLCYLEGQTQDEAARRLGWPRGTLKRRLERGRELLRRRLTRRGVTLGSGLFVSALAVNAAPAALRSAAVGAALAFRGGELTTPAALLARAALPSASALRLKALGVFVLVLGCAAATAGLVGRQALAPPQTDTKLPAEAKRVRVDRYGDALPEGAKLRLGTVRLRNGREALDAVFTPDGKTVIVSDSGGEIVFWDVARAREVRRLPRVPGYVHKLAITPDGKRLASSGLASGGAGETVYVWDIAAGKVLVQVPVVNVTSGQLLLTSDGQTLVVANGTATILVWDIANNRKLHELKGPTGQVAHMALSPDGKTLASGSWRDGHVRLWDLAAGKEKFHFPAHENDVFYVEFSPDGKMLATAGNAADHLFTPRPSSFRFWDAANGAKIREIPDHYPIAFAYFPDGKTLATIEGNRTLQTYDVQTGKLLRQYDGPSRVMTKMVIAPDGKTLATLWGAASAFDLWDATRGRLLHSFEGHQGGVGALAFAADDQTLFSADGTDRCLLTAWDTTTGALRGRFGTNEERGHALALSPDGKRLAIGSAESLKLWDPATQKEVRSYNPYWFGRGGGRPVVSVSWSADGKRLASWTTPDLTIRVWDVAANRQLRAIETVTKWPGEVALSPDGSILAGGGEPGRGIRRWLVADGKELPPLVESRSRVQTLAYSPDGSILAAGMVHGHIHLWNAVTDRLQHGWDTKAGSILRLAFSRDGRTLATGHEDNTVRLWEVATGTERACFVGHRGPAASVAFSHDGRTLASGSGDTTILLWDATCGARPGAKLTIEQLRALWDDLIGTDARRAYRAMWQLAVSPRAALPFLAERLRPAAPLNAAQQKQVERLLNDLDDEAFAVRQKAETELEKMGDAAEPALRKALEGKPSLEVRRRVEKLLEKITTVSGERLRTLRALEALEQMNTPEARRLQLGRNFATSPTR